MKLSFVSVILLTLSLPLHAIYGQWEKVCSARQDFFALNLRTENYQKPEELLRKFTSDPNVDLIILGEAHYQPSLPKTFEYLKVISESPDYNCLFIEATDESWQEDIEIAERYAPDHPLHFIKEFHEKVSALDMAVGFVDERQRFETWMRGHSFPMSDEELEKTAYEEITYRNLVMSDRIAEAMKGACKKGVLLIGVSHLSSFSHGFPVSNIKDLLIFEGLSPKAVYLLDSELFVGVDETLNDSIPSPSLCFSACRFHPDLPTTEVAFEHKYSEQISKSDLALIDAGKVDAHYGAPTVGHWSDFDATIIFPPRFVKSCQDSRRH